MAPCANGIPKARAWHCRPWSAMSSNGRSFAVCPRSENYSSRYQAGKHAHWDNGEILLSDFGIAPVAQSSRYQSTKDMAGTITYMAPEQIEAHPRPASDQYSLGIVTYEWSAGTVPFTAPSPKLQSSTASRHRLPSAKNCPPFTGDRAGRVNGTSQEPRTALRVRPCLCHSSGAGQSIQSISTEPATCTHRNCTKFAIATNSSRHPAISTCWATNDRNASKRFVHAGAN